MIPKRRVGSHEKYDGKYINLKEECRDDCEWYRHIEGIEYCGGGKHFQRIVEGNTSLKCGTRTLIAKGKIIEHSVEYLNSFIKK